MPDEAARSAVLGAALQLANTQLLAQSDDAASLDSQTMGLVAFNGALLATNLAARRLLGTWWFVPLIAIAGSTLLCLCLEFGTRGDLGPRATGFYGRYGGAHSVPAREQLLADLDLAFKSNARRIRVKHRGVRSARGILLAGLLVAGMLAAYEAPTRI